MLLITPYLAIAVASFIFAVLIEGEVYKQNIMAGVKKLLSKNFMQKTLAKRELKKHLKNEDSLAKSMFFKDYKEQKNYVKQLKAAHADKELIKKEKKRLKRMQKFFIKFLFKRKQIEKSLLKHDLKQLLSNEQRQKLLDEYEIKNTLNRAMSIFHILAGVSCTFASIYSVHSGALTLMGFLGISLAPSLLLGIIIPLAVMAGIGYSILMYHTVSDMIANDTLQRAFEKFKQFFEYQSDQNKFYFVAKIALLTVVASVVIGLCIFATVATAGTWWLAVKQGARLTPFFVKGAEWIRNVTIPAMALPTFLFNLKNSFATLKQLGKFSLTQNFNHLISEIQETKAQENWFQFLNPFRLLIKSVELPIQFACFVLHLVSICVMSDQLEPIPPIFTTSGNLANEALVDAHYLMDNGKHHDHDHGTIVTKLLFVILSPIYILSDLWAYSFTKEKNISFGAILKERFGLTHKKQSSELPPAPSISTAWILQEIKMQRATTQQEEKIEKPSHGTDSKPVLLFGYHKSRVREQVPSVAKRPEVSVIPLSQHQRSLRA
jgi:hypothetical protein